MENLTCNSSECTSSKKQCPTALEKVKKQILVEIVIAFIAVIVFVLCSSYAIGIKASDQSGHILLFCMIVSAISVIWFLSSVRYIFGRVSVLLSMQNHH